MSYDSFCDFCLSSIDSLQCYLKGTPIKDASWPENVQRFPFADFIGWFCQVMEEKNSFPWGAAMLICSFPIERRKTCS